MSAEVRAFAIEHIKYPRPCPRVYELGLLCPQKYEPSRGEPARISGNPPGDASRALTSEDIPRQLGRLCTSPPKAPNGKNHNDFNA